MKFNKNQIDFMERIGLSIPASGEVSDSDCELIEEKVAEHLQKHGFGENYEPTDEGKICESILDLL